MAALAEQETISVVGRRLLYAFAAVTALSLLSVAFNVVIFSRIETSQSIIGDRAIPITLTSQLLEKSVTGVKVLISSISPDQSDDRRAQQKLLLENEIRVLQEFQNQGRQIPEQASQIDTISQEIKSLFDDIARQIKLSETINQARIVQDAGIQSGIAQLNLALEDISPDIVDTVDHLRSSGPEDDMHIPSIARLQRLSEVRRRLEKHKDALIKLRRADSVEQVEQLRGSLSLNLRILVRYASDLQDTQTKSHVGTAIRNLIHILNENDGLLAKALRDVSQTRDLSQLRSENNAKAEEVISKTEELVQAAQSLTSEATELAMNVTADGRAWTLLFAVLSVLAALSIIWLYVYRNIVSRLSELIVTTRALAAGDFAQTVPDLGPDEIGEIAQALDGFKRKAVQVTEQERELTAVIDTVTDGLVIIDQKGVIRNFNPAAETLFGYREEDVVGHNVRMLMFDPHMGQHDQYIQNYLNTGEAKIMGRNRELEGRHSSGRAFNMELAIGEAKIADQSVFVGSIRDITNRKQREKVIRETMDDLRASNQELEQFAYVASHDLQEPLRMVASFTRLLADNYEKQLDDTAREYIGFAVDGAERMQQLIQALLEYSRVNTQGSDALPIDMEEMLKDVLSDLSVLIEESDAEITCDALPEVEADPVQLRRVLQNLLTNALKFRTPDKQCKIHVSAAHIGAMYKFTVKDNGIGIDPKFSDRIFTIFQRLHRRGEYPGEGVGLSITKRIIERHDGEIGVDSTVGEGSAFWFKLPQESRLRQKTEGLSMLEEF